MARGVKPEYDKEQFAAVMREAKRRLRWSGRQLAATAGINSGSLSRATRTDDPVPLPDTTRARVVEVVLKADDESNVLGSRLRRSLESVRIEATGDQRERLEDEAHKHSMGLRLGPELLSFTGSLMETLYSHAEMRQAHVLAEVVKALYGGSVRERRELKPWARILTLQAQAITSAWPRNQVVGKVRPLADEVRKIGLEADRSGHLENLSLILMGDALKVGNRPGAAMQNLGTLLDRNLLKVEKLPHSADREIVDIGIRSALQSLSYSKDYESFKSLRRRALLSLERRESLDPLNDALLLEGIVAGSWPFGERPGERQEIFNLLNEIDQFVTLAKAMGVQNSRIEIMIQRTTVVALYRLSAEITAGDLAEFAATVRANAEDRHPRTVAEMVEVEKAALA